MLLFSYFGKIALAQVVTNSVRIEFSHISWIINMNENYFTIIEVNDSLVGKP